MPDKMETSRVVIESVISLSLALLRAFVGLEAELGQLGAPRKVAESG